MCGRVLVGEQKGILITGMDGRQFSPKPNSSGNPGSMLPVVTDAMPDKVQQFRWGLLTAEDDQIHSKHKHARIETIHSVRPLASAFGAPTLRDPHTGLERQRRFQRLIAIAKSQIN